MSEKINDKIYDIIIAGGGISGLYTAYKLLKYYPNSKILIIEKNNYLGGRIKSAVIEGQSVDLGALRIPDTAKLTLKLIKDLNLRLTKFNTNVEVVYTREKLYSKTNLNKSQERYFLPPKTPSNQTAYDLLLETILQSLKINSIEKINEDLKIGTKKICNIGVYNFLISKFSHEQLAWIISSTAIESDLNKDLFSFCKIIFINKNYFIIKTKQSENGNMTELIKKLNFRTKKTIKLLNKKIELANFDETESLWLIEVLDIKYQKKETYKSKIFISTIPIFALSNLKIKIKKFISLEKILKLFINISKSRYYLQYDNKWWNYSSGEFIHPINERAWILSSKSNIILASYCDQNKSNLFKALTDKELSTVLHNGLCDIFNVDQKLTPKPIKIIKQEWEAPDNYVSSRMLPAKNNKKTLKNLIKPFKDKPFFIISDTITNNSGWIEGSLLSAENAITNIIVTLKK